MKDWKNWILIIICLSSLSVLSCRTLLDSATPADIPPISMRYAQVEPNDIGFPSLHDAKNIRTTIIVKHRTEQLNLKRLAQDDKLAYGDALGFIDTAIAEADALQDVVVGNEDQPYSILGILGGLTGGAFLGKVFWKRKGDYSPVEFEEAVAKAKEDVAHGNSA